jgi:uncharacterized membrane protein
MQNVPLILHTGCGLLFAIVALPLMLRRVPMNHAYGIRVADAFRSHAVWYDVNAYGGRLLFVCGLGLTTFGLFASRFAPSAHSPWFLAFLLLPIVAVLFTILPILRFARLRAASEQ